MGVRLREESLNPNNLQSAGPGVVTIVVHLPEGGYRISPGNKYHLVPDEKTASTVRRILSLLLGGTNRTEITKILNQGKILHRQRKNR